MLMLLCRFLDRSLTSTIHIFIVSVWLNRLLFSFTSCYCFSYYSFFWSLNHKSCFIYVSLLLAHVCYRASRHAHLLLNRREIVVFVYLSTLPLSNFILFFLQFNYSNQFFFSWRTIVFFFVLEIKQNSSHILNKLTS